MEPAHQFQVGDSIVVIGSSYYGELGTIIGVPDTPASDYRVVLESGKEIRLPVESLSPRQ